MAFVPLATPGPAEVPFDVGRPWWYLERADASGDLGWLRLEDEHLLSVAQGLYKPVWQLRARIEVTEIETSQAWSACMTKHRVWMHCQHALIGVHARFVELSIALRQLPLTRWELIAHFADWQQCLNELRGWMSMMAVAGENCKNAGFELPAIPVDLAARCARKAVETRHVGAYRGVFTRDLNVALTSAAYDVPVWLLLPFRPEDFMQLHESGLHRARYRKYGTAFCGYVHAIVRSHYDKPQPIADICTFSRSTMAYSDLVWNTASTVTSLDSDVYFVADSPAQPEPSRVPVIPAGGSTSLPPKPTSLPLKPTSLPLVPIAHAACGTPDPSSTPAAGPKKGRKKRKLDAAVNDENSEEGKPRKKRFHSVIKRLLADTGSESSVSPTDLVPQVEPVYLSALEPEADGPETEDGGNDTTAESPSTAHLVHGRTALPPLLALHASLRAMVPHGFFSTLSAHPSAPLPPSVPMGEMPVLHPSPVLSDPQRFADFGGYISQSGHPTFDGHELPAWIRDEDTIWPSLPWRRYILWELGELEFRYELFSLDLAIRQSHPEYTPLLDSAGDRYRQCKACWGGSDFVPGVDPKSNNKLCDPDPRERLVALRQFYAFMQPWPRAAEFLEPWESLVSAGGDIESVNCETQAFYDLESSIWHCYGQTYFDYRHHLPLIPHNRPDIPVA
ncbi:hypothetical protein AURDEDRAFT_163932 [Auricularia subglabra TFB-10046 SS5]|nr:hypothetical protein AURDEDRAFT_163932 [Auricularia subglabra TFB-10046 SS5]